MSLEKYLEVLEKHIKNYCSEKKYPEELYEPVNYIMRLSGKRLRPALTLIACDTFSGDLKKAIPACIGVEIFHNFTLVHDDIMDKAPLRRGKDTIHKKWDENTAILSGDVMMIMAYQQFEAYDGELFRRLVGVFNKAAREVCEGQQLDILYTNKNNVSIDDYIEMVRLKTAVLLGAALQLGAMLGNSSQQDRDSIYNFGVDLGIAYQLKDDYLDTFGNSETFGKKIGGDICENKRTYLFIKAIEVSENKDFEKLLDIKNEQEKIQKIRDFYSKYDIDKDILKQIDFYTQRAVSMLEKINISEEKKSLLSALAQELVGRQK